MWRCNHKYDNDEKCKTPHIYEDKLKELFIKAFNELIENKSEILQEYKEIIKVLGDTSKLEKEKEQLEDEAEVLVGVIRKFVEKNAHNALNQNEYENKYNELARKYEELKVSIEEKEKKRFNQKIKHENIKTFLESLEECDGLITEFDEELWGTIIQNKVVNSNNEVKFIFKDGMELKYTLNK